MAKSTLSSMTVLFLILFSTTLPPTIHSISYFQYKSLFSLSQSLLMRVANLRAARGDLAGSAWAKGVAEKLERVLGLGFWGLAWSAGWDYLRNYAWRDLEHREIHGAIADVNELMGFLSELTQANSDANRAAWFAQNYGNVLRISRRMLHRLLKVFAKSVQFICCSLYLLAMTTSNIIFLQFNDAMNLLYEILIN